MSGNKYIPPHLRKRNKNKNKKKDDKQIIDFSNNTQFPNLLNNNIEEINVNHDVNKWVDKDFIENNYIETKKEKQIIIINNKPFIFDKNVKKGWIVINKDSSKNSCNITQEENDYYDNMIEYNRIKSIKSFKNIISKKLLFNYSFNQIFYNYDDEDDDLDVYNNYYDINSDDDDIENDYEYFNIENDKNSPKNNYDSDYYSD